MRGLSYPRAWGIFLAQGSPNVPCTVRRILKLWTTREVPMSHFGSPLFFWEKEVCCPL